MSEYLSSKVRKMQPSATIAMSQKARELTAQGKDVISLSLGEPDFDTPDSIKEAAKRALDDGFTKYTPVPGLMSLRQAICTRIKQDLGIDYSPNQVVVSNGAKQSIANICLALLDPGDEVLLPAPYWVSYQAIVELNEGVVKTIKTNVDNNFKMTAGQLEDALSENTKLLIYSSPCNPSGSLYTKEELQSFVEVLEKYPNVFVVSDEIYEYVNYVGQHASIASFASVKDRVILVNGLSKAYSMTGWRLGYMLANTTVANACQKIQGQFTSGASSFGQKAAEYALLHAKDESMKMVEAFKKRRAIVKELLEDIPDVKVNMPDGAFYFFPDISAFIGRSYNGIAINNSDELCEFILEHALVAMVPGSAFGLEGYLRLSYATSEEILREALKRVKKTLALLK